MKKIAMPLSLFGSLMLSTAVFAGEGTVDFSTLDANQDGALSAEEAASDLELSKNWSVIDADENGVIDQAEFSAFEATQGAESPEQPME
jgi:Ca2+-binding EF-hand superfamily protein